MIPMQDQIHNSPTVDRLNPELGYEKDNIWIICHQCNKTKLKEKDFRFNKKSRIIKS